MTTCTDCQIDQGDNCRCRRDSTDRRLGVVLVLLGWPAVGLLLAAIAKLLGAW